jgi:hypothetical protein
MGMAMRQALRPFLLKEPRGEVREDAASKATVVGLGAGAMSKLVAVDTPPRVCTPTLTPRQLIVSGSNPFTIEA